MKYLLDTNICIYIIKQKPISVKQRFQSFDISDMGISIVTLGELEYGAAKSQNPSRNRQTLAIFCAPFEIVGLNPEDARIFGNIRADLEKRGQPIGSYDLLIAAQALSRGLTVVTNNVKEFSRINNLGVENWVE
ncbi:tRNA(fMet)-specific endonuclease VapC [Planktothrix agardhii]|jgi:tRNA(fMet)-specific endonuclease VapC|uniref:type II toxin-antitoxin system tRNA(fMet)-specific endonuclease VapC n=1 Tax=Planktothrix agardhii TaxID=1160 RepID=UPI000DBB0B28|nr:type II toxin-antitoxin system VapC family toxin [Planktothrix agardhii]BBD55312.1 PilT protein domain-containing protein [Planktothrix agardhii NIES-204]MCB8753229.1 type II toxin-antitoxin system VapC family toxin [Planktothrix agardhii 1810]MCB8763353.1 type II toxin-antitoxin system VapC family toxin [Planktothrix agardhii 1809]MCB8777003.1 type II toxin-antitoxin system VapC family toxin [Planktothrix agardhii 1031]MCB8781433.1 type II toxin-antitoxin system VapC family toxin [Planktot